MPKFLAVDFYCGAGGTTRGLLDADGYIIAGIDKNETCRATCEHNNRNTKLDCIEPTFLPFDMFPASAEYPGGQQQEIQDALDALIPHYQRMAPGRPMLFSICAPCQSFTNFIQNRMTQERTRTRIQDQTLLAQSIKFIDRFRPELILSENVGGLTKGKYSPIREGFQNQLRKLGYQVGANRICASRFGIAQYRRRSIMPAPQRWNKARTSTAGPLTTWNAAEPP